jgi:hypothetical protein
MLRLMMQEKATIKTLESLARQVELLAIRRGEQMGKNPDDVRKLLRAVAGIGLEAETTPENRWATGPLALWLDRKFSRKEEA